MRNLIAILALVPLVACNGGEETGDTHDSNTPDDTNTLDDTGNVADCVEEGGACVLSGTYTEDMVLTSDKAWLLRSAVIIGDDVNETTLRIQPGTRIYGESATNGLLIISRHANIVAEGTVSAPIVFTSDQPVGSRARGDWGGLVINGLGKINACTDGSTPCEAEGEGGTGTYGGSDNADDSGSLKYVVIEFGGTEISKANEVNGLGLQGVGSGTTLDYIQVHNTLDDCIEFWGGAVNATHLVCTSPGDDGIDWDLGYQGKIQFAVVQQILGGGNNGFEGDNNPDDYAAEPLTTPTIVNVTLVGDEALKEDNFGMLIRKGTQPKLQNLAVMDFSKACLSLRDSETLSGFTSGDAWITHSVLACASAFEDTDEEPIFTGGEGNSIAPDLGLVDPLNPSAPDFRLKSGSVLATGGEAPSDSFFQQVSYKGAFDATNDWTAGWTHHDED
ncbi:MAG: hypothetical protein JXB39_13980 [Deltaproteobacteria bacterium]|nr:hypothetical protein [Deltaproteobacteria bacterium]